MCIFKDVSVNTFQDADAVFDNVKKFSDIIPFTCVMGADIQPGLVYLCHNPLNDKITWASRERAEIRGNGQTLWRCTSEEKKLIKYTTNRHVGRDKIYLTAYLRLGEEEKNFMPAKIKFASISSFRARVLRDAKDVACGLGMEIESLLQVALTFESSNALHKELLLLEQSWQNTECLPAGKRHQRKWGPLGGDAYRSGGVKRKASSDAPEKMRKRKKKLCDSGRFSDRLDPSLSQGEQFVATSTATSDRHVGFGSPQEVTVSDADRVLVHPFHRDNFFLDGLAGSLALTSPHKDAEQQVQAATQEDLYSRYNLHESRAPEENFEKYRSEMFADMFDISRIPGLDHGLVVQHGHCESFALNQGQHHLAESFTQHLGYPPERSGHFQNADQLQRSFDESFSAHEGAFDGYGHVLQYGHGENFALQGTSTQRTQHRPLGTPLQEYLPESWHFACVEPEHEGTSFPWRSTP